MTNEFKSHLGMNLEKTRIGYYIDSVARNEVIVLNAEFEKIGITFPQFRVLNWLWRYDELTQKELHQLVSIKPSSLTTILNVLIKKGYVERKFDSKDARVRKIVLTDSSRKIEKDAWKIMNDYDQRIRSALSDEEYEVTLRSLSKLMNLK